MNNYNRWLGYTFHLSIFLSFYLPTCLYADFELVGRGVGTARAFALNNAFTAIADDTNAIFYNPAG
ncbi:MAG: hypothetical protein AB1349_02545, partial [Elusimicrobiota bacterium]